MRKITREIVNAFMERKPRSISNSSTDGTTLYLHGNAIARHTGEGVSAEGLEISMAGWPSNTTRERLNGLPWVRINQSKGVQYLNGHEIKDTRAWLKPYGYGGEA